MNPHRPSSARRRVAVMVLASLVAFSTACSPASNSDEASPQRRPGSSAAATPSTAAPSDSGEVPVVGACFDYSNNEVEQTYATEGPVDCSQSHTAETYRVEVWPDPRSPHDLTDEDRRKVAEPICLPLPESVAGVLTYWAYYVPSPEQWEAGERWVRCDGMVSLNDSETAFAQWTGSVVKGETTEVLPQGPNASPSEARWKALPSPPSNPTYVILKRVLPRADGSHLLTVDPLTPDFDSGPGQGCETFYIAQPQEGFYCLSNVTVRDRKVTLLPNAEIYFGDSQAQSMSDFLRALEQAPAAVTLGLDGDGYAESILAVPLSNGNSLGRTADEPTGMGDPAESQWLLLWNGSSAQMQDAQCSLWRQDPQSYLQSGAAAIGFESALVNRMMQRFC